jgi:plasmid stabilization system protein ParE
MPNFELSYLADDDIAGIIGYTIEKWDIAQAIRYVDFHQERAGNDPLILAVFHERMELMERLNERLTEV